MCDPQDDQPRGFALSANDQSPSTLDSALGPRKKECTLAPSFTVNNRYHFTRYSWSGNFVVPVLYVAGSSYLVMNGEVRD